MNKLPIELTLYYPTALQVENYLGFMAMVSILFSLLVVLTATVTPTRLETKRLIDDLHFLACIINPVGFASLTLAGYNRFDDSVLSFAVSILGPALLIIPFSFLW